MPEVLDWYDKGMRSAFHENDYSDHLIDEIFNSIDQNCLNYQLCKTSSNIIVVNYCGAFSSLTPTAYRSNNCNVCSNVFTVCLIYQIQIQQFLTMCPTIITTLSSYRLSILQICTSQDCFWSCL